MQQISFIEKVTNDFRSNSMFLLLNVESKSYSGPVIIENDDLYLFYAITKKFTKEDYKAYIKSILKDKKVLKLSNLDLKKWGFQKFHQDKRINCPKKLGIDTFIKLYFNNKKVLKDDISENQKNIIIEKLFMNQISCFIDDETGYLVIK